MLEKQLGMPHSRSNSVLQQYIDAQNNTNGEQLHKTVQDEMRRTTAEAKGEGLAIKLAAHERWQVARKAMLDKRAISMIEARMQQEANELQLMEGWRAAARNSIRDKFVDTRHRNTIVERHLDFLHTRDKLAPATGGQGYEASMEDATAEGRDSPEPAEGTPFSPDSQPATEERVPSSLSEAADDSSAVARDQQPSPTETLRSKSTLPLLRSGRSSPLPDIDMTPGEVEEYNFALDSLDQIDSFNTTIGERQVRPNQRLRSLAVDSTKSWTRPMPRSHSTY